MHAPFTINSNDTKIVVEPVGEGPPIVFAHGLTGTRHTTQNQFASLRDRYTIVTYDQRGHGDSAPLTDPAAYDVRRMADDMACVMDSLGIERAVIGGESMGSATAVMFALRYPERVDRLLLTAPAFGDEESTERERFHQIAALIRAVGLQEFVTLARRTWTNDFGWSDQVADTVAASFLAHDSASIATAIDAVMEWVPLPEFDSVRSITCPVCIIYWNDDALHPAALTHRLASVLPDVQVVEVPSLPFVFYQAERIGQIFQEFLEERRVAYP